MLIEPSAEFTDQLPSYVVAGKTGRIKLSAVHGDDCRSLGSFADMLGLTAELTSRLLSVTYALGRHQPNPLIRAATLDLQSSWLDGGIDLFDLSAAETALRPERRATLLLP